MNKLVNTYKTREVLHNRLISVIGVKNAYFQPPATLKMQYPCIIYSVLAFESVFADNKNYLTDTAYNVIYVTKNPDNDVYYRMLNGFDKCTFVNYYIFDNLHHYKFKLYFG